MSQGPERPPHFGEGPPVRTEEGLAGPEYIDYPIETDEGFEAEPAEVEAIPVEIVSAPPDRDRFISHTSRLLLIVADRPTQVLSRDQRRTRALLKNSSASINILLLDSVTAVKDMAFKFHPTNIIELFTNDEVWAITPGGTDTAELGVFAEYHYSEDW